MLLVFDDEKIALEKSQELERISRVELGNREAIITLLNREIVYVNIF